MRRASRQPLLRPAAALLAGLVVAALAGCGGGTAPGGTTAGAGAGSPGTSAVPSPEPSGPEGQGRLADAYAYEDRPGTTLAAGEEEAVPFEAPAAALGALAEAGVVMPAGGATTVACDLGDEGSVALRLDAEGGWSLVQTTAAGDAELDAGVLGPGQRGEPGELTAVRLLCSSSPEGLAVGVSLHGAGVTFVEGATGDVPAGGPTWTVASTGTADVRLETVLLTLVEA